MNSKVSEKSKLSSLVKSIIAQEESILNELEVEHNLYKLIIQKEGLKNFAEAFYFVRYNFCRLNFILGERCGNNDFLWRGLVRNLLEELGGQKGISHNQLYRDFLDCVGIHSEDSLQDSIFSYQFNASWEKFCRDAPLLEAIAAISVYEVLDKPDYALLLRVLEKAGIEDVISWLSKQEKGEEIINNGRNFVFRTQRMMWAGLLNTLEEVSMQNALIS
jgi:hypothetical protein